MGGNSSVGLLASIVQGVPAIPLHANNLFQRVNHFDKIGLSRHHGVNRLVGPRRLVNHAFILATLHAIGGLGGILSAWRTVLHSITST